MIMYNIVYAVLVVRARLVDARSIRNARRTGRTKYFVHHNYYIILFYILISSHQMMRSKFGSAGQQADQEGAALLAQGVPLATIITYYIL